MDVFTTSNRSKGRKSAETQVKKIELFQMSAAWIENSEKRLSYAYHIKFKLPFVFSKTALKEQNEANCFCFP